MNNFIIEYKQLKIIDEDEYFQRLKNLIAHKFFPNSYIPNNKTKQINLSQFFLKLSIKENQRVIEYKPLYINDMKRIINNSYFLTNWSQSLSNKPIKQTTKECKD